MSPLPRTAGRPSIAASSDAGAAVARWLAPGHDHPWHGEPVPAAVTLHHFGYVRLIACAAGPLRVARGSRPSAEDTAAAGDAVALVVPRDGAVRLVQDGRGAEVRSGQLALLDLRRAFSAEQVDAARMLFFRLPAHVLHIPGDVLRTLTARALTPSGGVAALLAPLLRRLDDTASRIPAAVGERLGGIVTELVAALVDDAYEAYDSVDSSPRTGPEQLIVTIRRYIDQHLDDPGLSAEGIARAHLISVRYLHRLFQGEEVTVGRLILRRRVEECARELARRGRVSPSISVVATRWGFRNAAHFSRAFKAVHGQSPQQWRRLAAAAATGSA
ncbi:helix-turn-helix domain-containing protein [Streptomyces gibsoniae]|uniref:Helix-turn-helix domain-containing protein n=1 Tax=Streptomyces gibsoniae TaxID=3075529 RepID=A0ABU2TVC1_9ACTN|nr:helix-turn-helix domain-containing protein [Streptomyces sp. DSM 41699]MDT0464918.1 helix-turn-helix domain-containing protein [Streptomyces sp. DSM 41699]